MALLIKCDHCGRTVDAKDQTDKKGWLEITAQRMDLSKLSSYAISNHHLCNQCAPAIFNQER